MIMIFYGFLVKEKTKPEIKGFLCDIMVLGPGFIVFMAHSHDPHPEHELPQTQELEHPHIKVALING